MEQMVHGGESANMSVLIRQVFAGLLIPAERLDFFRKTVRQTVQNLF